MSLHVAIECRVIDPHFPGIGKATLETVRALAEREDAPRLSLLVSPDPPPALADLAEKTESVTLVPVRSKLRHPSDQWVVPLALRSLRPDLFHATYYAVPWRVPCPMVVTVYDMIPQLFPEYWPGITTRTIINGWSAHAIKAASLIIACSTSTKTDINQFFPDQASKVRVVPLGVHLDEGQPKRPAVDETLPTILYVGSNKPHKNLPRLIEAFADVHAIVDRAHLTIVGAWDSRYEEGTKLVNDLGLQASVTFEHRPSDGRLRELFATSMLFVFPSLYEGFGLPVLEAMAAGLPVASSTQGSLMEVAGGAVIEFNPADRDDMSSAMLQLLTDTQLRRNLVSESLQRARMFPWSKTAEGTLAGYKEVAQRTKTRPST